MAYWRLFYHFVWTTKNREPLLTPEIEAAVYRVMDADAKKMYCPLCVIGGIEDHSHVVAAVRPALSPADFIKQLKGASSHFVTHVLKQPFEWQEGYGVLSVSEADVPRVIEYVRNQKQRHAARSLVDDWERVHNWNLGPSEEAYKGWANAWDMEG